MPPRLLIFASFISACSATPTTMTSRDGGADAALAKIDGAVDARGPEFVGLHRAYFLLQASHLRSAGWPADFADYDLFICNPALQPIDVAKVRSDIPGAIVLAYTNTQDVPIHKYVGNPYYDALTAAFPEAHALHDLDTGSIINLYDPDPDNPQFATPSWIPNSVSSDALVAFHRDVTMLSPWDGIYVDESTQVFPQWKINRLIDVVFAGRTPNFDVDGNGQADSVQTLLSNYSSGRPYFTAQLRAALPATAIVIGNAGGPLQDSAFNGITLEGIGHRFSITTATGYIEAQHAVAVWPKLSVAWVTDQAYAADAAALAAAVPGVVPGDVL